VAAPPVQRICSRSSFSAALKQGMPVATILDSWNFDVWEMEASEIDKVAAWLLTTRFSGIADPSVTNAFTQAVCDGYLPNAYHNARHGLDVMHAVCKFGELIPWNNVYSGHEQLALLVAALGHDIGHFGFNNAFLIETRDDLAMRYNDTSPLENMHCVKLFLILSQERANMFKRLSQDDYRCIRKTIIDGILHTDISLHDPIVTGLTRLYSNNAEIFSNYGMEMWDQLCTEENKKLIVRTLMHGADLSNPCKPWKSCFAWAKAVLEEFFAQGDEEKRLGLPIGMLNDRNKVSLPNSQLGFIQFMVAPLTSAYVKIFTTWQCLATTLASNTEEWARLFQEESGTDSTNRVQAVCSMLKEFEAEIASTTTETKAIEDSSKEGLQACDGSTQSTDVGSDAPEARQVSPYCKLAHTAFDSSKGHVVVREVRRWREEHTTMGHDVCSKPWREKDQHRELVLLLMHSDDPDSMLGSRGQDFNLKFNADKSHFGSPEAPTYMQVLDTPVMEAPQVVTVAVAPDVMHSKLDRGSFDGLLTGLLNSRQEEEKHNVEKPCSSSIDEV
jgi:hypothetical protein